jgi:hypothetical protein
MIHIIGGGLQGCFFAIALQELAGISHDAIRIYDPAPRLLDTWLRQTAACGMSHLRSSSSHSIHPDFNHLRNFARSRGIDLWKPGPFSMPYHRPSLELFNDHAAHCIGEYRLESLHVRARVDRLLPGGGIGIAAEELPGIALYAGGSSTAASISLPGQRTSAAEAYRRITSFRRKPQQRRNCGPS